MPVDTILLEPGSDVPQTTKGGMLSWNNNGNKTKGENDDPQPARRRRRSRPRPKSDAEEGNEDDDDPVMVHFRNRTTKKVSFAEHHMPSAKEQAELLLESPSTLKRFMSGALFGGSSRLVDDEIASVVSESSSKQHPPSNHNHVYQQQPSKRLSSAQRREIQSHVTKLRNKAARALHIHHRYKYAVKCHVKALDYMSAEGLPPKDPLVTSTLEGLDEAHALYTSYTNSANIVRMGIKAEDTGQWIRALKLYTVAYRIRRDQLSEHHPSLPVLLNLLGSIQIKRGELLEALQILELALQNGQDVVTRSVTYREMGRIYELQGGMMKESLEMYHGSLQCLATHRGMTRWKPPAVNHNSDGRSVSSSRVERPYRPPTPTSTTSSTSLGSKDDDDDEGMEMSLDPRQSKGDQSEYDQFFPLLVESPKDDIKSDAANVEAATTLHRIAQLQKSQGEFKLALSAFNVAIRGMKNALGKYHPNVAAIQANLGNMRKEMGDLDQAFETYQQVLAIESYRLGLSHPDVTVTLHNIATIDAARGNHKHALALYEQVRELQQKLFGPENESIAVTSACMGDVYERLGDVALATDCFEEALRIQMITKGRHAIEVARLFHKLGKLSIVRCDYQLAEICISKALLVYRFNSLADDHVWMVDANRDAADIDAAIAMGRGVADGFEC